MTAYRPRSKVMSLRLYRGFMSRCERGIWNVSVRGMLLKWPVFAQARWSTNHKNRFAGGDPDAN